MPYDGWATQLMGDQARAYDHAQFYGPWLWTIGLKDGSWLTVFADDLKVGFKGELEIWVTPYGSVRRENLDAGEERPPWEPDYNSPKDDARKQLVFAADQWLWYALGEHGFETSGVVWHSRWTDNYDKDGSLKRPREQRTDSTTDSRRKPISWATRQWVKERDAFRCRKCGTHENLTVDHIIAVANGGSNEPENLQTLCQSCNSVKGKR